MCVCMMYTEHQVRVLCVFRVHKRQTLTDNRHTDATRDIHTHPHPHPHPHPQRNRSCLSLYPPLPTPPLWFIRWCARRACAQWVLRWRQGHPSHCSLRPEPVCVYVCVCGVWCVCIYIYRYICICIYMCIYLCVNTNTHTHTHTSIKPEV